MLSSGLNGCVSTDGEISRPSFSVSTSSALVATSSISSRRRPQLHVRSTQRGHVVGHVAEQRHRAVVQRRADQPAGGAAADRLPVTVDDFGQPVLHRDVVAFVRDRTRSRTPRARRARNSRTPGTRTPARWPRAESRRAFPTRSPRREAGTSRRGRGGTSPGCTASTDSRRGRPAGTRVSASKYAGRFAVDRWNDESSSWCWRRLCRQNGGFFCVSGTITLPRATAIRSPSRAMRQPGPPVVAIEHRIRHPDRVAVVADSQRRPGGAAGVARPHARGADGGRSQRVEIGADVVAGEERQLRQVGAAADVRRLSLCSSNRRR